MLSYYKIVNLMKNLLIYICFALCVFCVHIASAQDSIQTKKHKNAKDQKVDQEVYVADTIVNGKVVYKKEIPLKEGDSLIFKLEKDNEFASQIDQQWLDEFYSNALYDTIYKSVTDMDFKTIEYPNLPTDTLKKRLKALNARTPFNIEYNRELESVIKNYLKNRRKALQKLVVMSQYYFPMFEQELDKHNIPLEIKYLSIVESALKPRAKSRVGATGLWQFMFTTGKLYELDVSSYVDERSDPLKSTNAAAQYLARLYKIFGDWDLALAAYNSGPGNVSKAIRRSGGYQNYWNIRTHLPRETAGYVPAFLATMYIFEYADEHNFKKIKPEYAFVETDTVHVKHMITLDQVAEVTGVNIETLQFLNPSYKLDIIPYIKEENYTLCLPKTEIGNFVTNEKRIYAFAKAEFDKREKPLPQFFKSESKIRYRVKSGDYLGKIARKYGVRISQIKKWNGLRNNNLRIGQRLSIFPRTPATSTTRPSKVSKTTKKTKYTVQSGDTLWSISQKFSGVSIQNIKDWNDISSTKLKPGMVLIVSQ